MHLGMQTEARLRSVFSSPLVCWLAGYWGYLMTCERVAPFPLEMQLLLGNQQAKSW